MGYGLWVMGYGLWVPWKYVQRWEDIEACSSLDSSSLWHCLFHLTAMQNLHQNRKQEMGGVPAQNNAAG